MENRFPGLREWQLVAAVAVVAAVVGMEVVEEVVA
jgi:hypothetical protein